jgi:CRP-like cAMP-binding protein
MSISHNDLRLFTPFNTMNPEYLDKVIEKASLREVPKGTIIFKRGKEQSEAFYLISGQVDLIDALFAITSLSDASEERRSALNNITPTQVSALAKSPVTLLVVERDFLDLVMAWSESGDEESMPEDDDSDWMSSLLQAPLFSKIPPANIRQLFERFKVQKVTTDEVIIKEGERGDYFYVLESGSAMVMDKSGNILAALRPGDFFGEEALAGETTRNATVKMLTAGKLRRLQKEDFKALLLEPVLQYVTMEDLQKRATDLPAFQLLDVRLPLERRFQSVPGSRNIPLSNLRKNLPELDTKITYVITDDAGRRSDVAAQLLHQTGFDVAILQQAAEHYSA